MIDASQRKAAKLVGIVNPLILVIVGAAFFRFCAPLTLPNNFSGTAHNIALHQHSFLIYLACCVIYGVGIVALCAALYVILRSTARGVALFATFCRLTYAFLWFVLILNLFGALRIVSGAGYLKAFEPDRLEAMAAIQLASSWDAYYIGLTFYGLSSLIFALLWFKSGYIPRALAAAGILASFFEGFCAFAYLIVPGFGKIVSVDWYEAPVVLFEIGTSVWLLMKGLKSTESVQAAKVGN